MSLKSAVVIIFSLFISTSIFSQTKVGTYAGGSLSYVPSVSSLGMGEVGVSLVNEKSMYFNPGSLGLYFKESKFTISGYPGMSKIRLLDFYNASLSMPIKRYDPVESPFIYGLGFYYSQTRASAYGMDYEGNIIKSEFSDKNYNLVLSGAYCGKIEIGSGLNFKYIRNDMSDLDGSTFAFDWGVVARIPITTKFEKGSLSFISTPSFGFSMSNFGDSYDYDIPTTTRYGMSVELGFQKVYDNGLKRRLLTLIVSHDIEKCDALSTDKTRIGGELWVAELLSLRVGQISYKYYTNTYGFSLSTKGLFRLFNSSGNTKSFHEFMRDKFEIKYSYAKNSYDDDSFLDQQFTDPKYHEIVINYNI